MRFIAATLPPLLLLASSIKADDTCTCAPSNQGSIASGVTSYYDGTQSSPIYQPQAVQEVPKVQPTEQNLVNGAQNAIAGLASQNVIPPELAQPLAKAVQDAISQQAAAQRVVYAEAGATITTTVTPSVSYATQVSTISGQNVTVTATQTITALPPGATILSNQTLLALGDIQNSINDAIAAVNLSKTGLDSAAQAELSNCLHAVMSNGGLPAGYSCISQSGSTQAGLQATFNNVLEQFLGILPAKIIDDLQGAVMPMLTGLLPNERTLLNNINSAMSSVVSSLSGNSVTAIEMMQSCYSMAIKQNSNTSYLQCYMSDGGPFATLQTAMNSVVQQFVGYLPGTVLESVQNLTSATLTAGASNGLGSIGTNLTAQLDNALSSVTSALTGNSVTLMQQLQECANKVLISGDASAAKNCLVQKAAVTAQTMVDSVAQQYSGYLPSSFFSDLVQVLNGMSSTGNYSAAQLTSALDKAFNNANMGPAYVGCFNQVQACVLNNIQVTGNYSAKCPAPVAGCQLIGSQNSTALGVASNATASNTTTLSTNTTVLPPSSANVALASNATSSSVSSSSVILPASSSSGSIASSSAPASSSSSASVAPASASGNSSASVAPSTSSSAPSSSAAPSSSSSAAPASSSAPSSSTPVVPVSSSSSSTSVSSTAVVRRGHKKLRMSYAGHYKMI